MRELFSPTFPGPAKPGEGTEQKDTDWDTPGRKPPRDLFSSQAPPASQGTHSAERIVRAQEPRGPC